MQTVIYPGQALCGEDMEEVWGWAGAEQCPIHLCQPCSQRWEAACAIPVRLPLSV